MARTTTEVRALQAEINDFTRRQRLGYTPLLADGHLGPCTRRRLREVKFDLGYQRKNLGGWDDCTLKRLRHPTRVEPAWGATRDAVRRGRKRRLKRRARIAANHAHALVTTGVTYFDGVPVAAAFVPYLAWARRNGWRGRLVSGWRSPAYSESLCLRMCGRPACPGRCAGRSSRHSQTLLSTGAIDVSDYVTFGQLMARAPFGTKLCNRLGRIDPVHFSVAGN